MCEIGLSRATGTQRRPSAEFLPRSHANRALSGVTTPQHQCLLAINHQLTTTTRHKGIRNMTCKQRPSSPLTRAQHPPEGRGSARRAGGLCTTTIALGLLGSPALGQDIDSLPYYITAPGTYTMTADLHQIGSTAISIAASNVVLDLGGHTLSGAGGYDGGYGYGVGVGPGVSNVTIRNGTIEDFSIETGILLYQTTGCTVSGVTVQRCGGGVSLLDSNQNTILNNTLDHNIHANIGVINSSTNIVQGNTCLGDASWGIRMGGASAGNFLVSNTCDGAFAWGIDLTDGTIVIANTTTNQSIGIHGEEVDGCLLQDNISTGNLHGILLAGNGNTLHHNTVNDNADTGFFLAGAGISVHHNTANGNGSGFYVLSANGSTIKDNTANGNTYDGIIVWTSGLQCGGNTITKNTANGNGHSGVEVFGCVSNIVKDNTTLGNAAYGVAIVAASGNEVEKNTATGNVLVDVVDDTCAANVWKRNQYVTSSGACIN